MMVVQRSIVFLLLLTLLLLVPTAHADSTGEKFPSANSVLNGAGWANPTNAYSDNAVYATASAGALNASNYTSYGLSIPAGSTINGIQVRIAGKSGGASGTNIFSVSIWNGSAWSAVNSTADLSTTPLNTTLGGTNNLWGLNWNGTTANNIRINVSAPAANTQIMSLDTVAINITYTNSSTTYTNLNTSTNTSWYNHSVSITSTAPLVNYSFEWNATGVNCDQGFQNATNGTLSGLTATLNINQSLPATCSGKTIGWRIHTTTIDRTNASSVQTYQAGGCGLIYLGNVTLQSSFNTTGTCIQIGGNNIIVNGNGFRIQSNGSGVGINNTGYNNIIIKNFANISNFTNGLTFSGSNYSTVQNNTIATTNVSGAQGVYVEYSIGTNITSNNISGFGDSSYALYMLEANSSNVSLNIMKSFDQNTYTLTLVGQYNVIQNNTLNNTGKWGMGIDDDTADNNQLLQNIILIDAFGGRGVQTYGSSNVTIHQNIITTRGVFTPGVYLTGATYLIGVNLSNNSITAIGDNAINVEIGNSTIQGNILNITNSSAVQINFTLASNINGTTLIDQEVGSYNFVGVGGKINFKKLGMAEINFTTNISGNGTNLSSDVWISSNNVTVNSSKAKLNKTANIAFYGVSTNAPAYSILRDGVICSSAICTNLTPLNAGTVKFNVTGWSSYSISTSVICGSTITSSATLTQNYASTGTCFTIGANNIVIDGAGYTISGDGTGSAISSAGFNNITIKNLNLSTFTYGIVLNNSNNSNITNNSIWTNFTAGYGIYLLSGSRNNTITTNTITTVNTTSYGILLNSTSNNVTNNTITTSTTSTPGIYFNGTNNTATSNIITTLGTAGDGMTFNIANNTAISNTIISGGKGMTITGVNTTVQLNIITATGATGITISSANNSIINNTVNATVNLVYGIDIAAANNNVSANVIYVNGSTTEALRISAGGNSTVSKNIITTTGLAGYGVEFGVGTSNNTAYNNTIRTSGSSGYGMYINAANSTAYNNYIFTTNTTAYGMYFNVGNSTAYTNNITTSNTNSYGMYISAANNSIYSNNITTTGSSGHDIYLNGLNNSAYSNNLTTTGANGVAITFNATNNTAYNNTIRVTGSTGYGILFQAVNNTATNNNITANNNLVIGIYLNAANNTANSNALTVNGSSANGIYFNKANNTASYNNISTNGSSANAIYFFAGSNNTANSNNITTYGASGYGIFFNSGNSTANSNNINTSGYGIYFNTANNTASYNNISTSSSSAYGIYFNLGSNNTANSNTINTTQASSIYLAATNASNNILQNNTIYNTNPITYHLEFGTAGINGTTLIDQDISTYNISGEGSLINFKKTGIGEINFTQNISGSGVNLSSDIQIKFNSTYINESKAGLNRSANITFYGLNTVWTNTNIAKDGSVCSANTCTNLTLLTAGTVVMNTTSGGNYSITGTAFVPIECGIITTNTTLNGNITANGTCFTIGADNITLNGAGYSIIGNTTDYGVNITGHTGITIKNFGNISNFSYGIYLDTSNNSLIVNNTLDTADAPYGEGVLAYHNSTNNTIANNTISTRSDYTYGIDITSNNTASGNTINATGSGVVAIYISENATAANNTITASGGGGSIGIQINLGCTAVNNSITSNGSGAYGMYLSGTSNVLNNNTIIVKGSNTNGIYMTYQNSNNTVSGNTVTANDSAAQGIYSYGSINNFFSSNTVTSNATSLYLASGGLQTATNNMLITENGTGLLISAANATASGNTIISKYGDGMTLSGSNDTAINNTINLNGTSSIGLYVLSGYNIATGNTITTNGSDGYGIYFSAANNTVSNNTIKTTNAGAYGIYIFATRNETIANNTITTLAATSIYIGAASAANNIIQNNTINNTNISTYDLELGIGGINGTTLIDQQIRNYTFNGVGGLVNFRKTGIGEINFTRAINGSGTNLSSDVWIAQNNATVNSSKSGLNKSANITLYGITPDGGNTIYRDAAACPGTICTALTSLAQATVSFNVTQWSSYSIQSVSATCGITISTNITLSSNLTSTGTCFTVGSNNVIIDGAGYTITGNTSGYGINITNYNNTVIKNFAGINNFTNGIYVSNSNNSNITNNTINTDNQTANSHYGIQLLANSKNNTISSNIISSNGTTGTGIYFNSGYNLAINNTITTNGSSAHAINMFTANNSATNNIITTNGDATGIYMFTANNSATNNIITTNGNSAPGIQLSANTTATNNTIVTSGSGGTGIAMSSNSSAYYNTIQTMQNIGILFLGTNSYAAGNNISSSGNAAVRFDADNNTIYNNTISSTSTAVSVFAGGYNFIINNTISTSATSASGLSFTVANNTAVGNIISTTGSFAYGIIFSGANNSAVNNTINTTKASSIYFSSASANISTLNNNTIFNTNVSTYHLQFSAAGINGTTLIDQEIGNYTFTGVGGLLNIRKTNLGEVNFTAPINGSGTNLSSDIRIVTNNITVNSTKSGLNKTANITLYGITPSAGNAIYRDGVACPGTICTNLTSLNGATITFNVTGWSSYYIYDTSITDSCTPPALNSNWVVNASDNCVKSGQNINLGTGQVIITGNGYLKLVNSNLTASNVVVGDGSGLSKIILENSKLIRATG